MLRGNPFLGGLLTCIFVLANSLPAVEVVVDGAVHHQTITGMGAMLYPYSSPYDAPDFPEFFARDTGCSIARMEVIPNALKEEPADLDTFLKEPLEASIKRLNFSVDTIKKIGVVVKPLLERKLDEFHLIASVWSPPKWMKTNNKTTGGGNLRADRREHFAKYLAAYCKGFEQVYGVPIFALSIQNEPAFKEPYNSCIYDFKKADYGETTAEVGRTLKNYKLATKLFGPEHMATDGLGGFWYNGCKQYVTQVLKQPDAAGAFLAWGFHGYAADGKTVASAAKGWKDYADLAREAKKELWMTETSGNTPEWVSTEKQKDGTPGRPNGALAMNLNMHEALVYGNLNAWIYWSFQDGKSVSQYNLTSNGDRNSKKLASARHYFRYIRPGAVRIEALPTTPELTACAFVHEGQKTLTLVLSNQTDKTEPMTVKLKNLTKVQTAKLIGFRTSAEETWKALDEIRPAGGTFKIDLSAHSVVTLTSAPAAK